MQVAIIKYNAGNIKSVDYALRRIGVIPLITDDKERILSADKVVFPGQGEAGTTMKFLIDQGLDRLIKNLKQPVLGICIGMQLMCKFSEESADMQCLGIFDAEVKKFVAQKHEDKIPHVGWNSLSGLKSEIFTAIPENAYTYFVHSYYVPVNNYTTAICDYINPFSAAMCKDNFYATQFHPEKSGSVGEQILRNFMNL
ncbi:MAG: imidazole glycerol phosphate synthase subunit HisH [Tannerella sp.]|jgi:glutamine amidotransferase|nr:imidazole glycerol phosphate synthase subunit HisH [Tannerella sp.]